MGDVAAVAKFGQYLVSLFADPVLATWRARREVEANRIRALGETENMKIRAVGAARASVSAMVELAGGSENLSALLEDEIDKRIESHFEKRVHNLAQIAEKALHALPAGEVPDVEPDMAWTSSFSEAAQDISDEDMQELWARVLAGQVTRPRSTSVRTLSILRNLDQSTAQTFKRFCSMAMSITIFGKVLDHRVASLSGTASQNSLREYGLSFDELNVLNEYGLVIGEHNTQLDYRVCIDMDMDSFSASGLNMSTIFTYQGGSCKLVTEGTYDPTKEFPVSGPSLTRAGRELSRAVELEHIPEYDEALRGYFAEHGFQMKRVGSGA